MNNKQKELNRRVNSLVVVAFVVFMVAAKFILPYEEELEIYGATGAVFIVLILSLISYLIELLISKLIKKYKES